MISVPCVFRFELGSRLEIKRSIDEETVSDHLDISNAISDALSTPEVSGNSHLSTFASFFDDTLLGQFMTDDGFDLGRYIESVHIARTVRYEDGTEPLLGSLNLPRNRSTLLQWIKSSVDPQAIAGGNEPLSAFWLGPQARFWARSYRVRSLTDQVNRLLRGKKDDDDNEDLEREKQRKESGLRTILQLAGVKDWTDPARVHRYNFIRLFGTAGQILDGKCELFLLPNRFVAALFHYIHNHPVSVPVGFISSDAGHIETARRIFEELTTGKHKAHPLNQEPEEEIDLKKEFAALASV